MHAAWAAVSSVLPVISLVIVIAGLAGGSFRISQNARTISVYRDAAQAWQIRAQELGADNDDLRAENDRLRSRLGLHADREKPGGGHERKQPGPGGQPRPADG